MPALCRRLNFRNIELHPDTAGQTVGVYMANGKTRQVRWLGFLPLEQARRLERARAVKLDAARYSDTGFDWIDLAPGEFVQGCLTADGAYAVTMSRIRVVKAGGPHR
jgi:hypothetical protein